MRDQVLTLIQLEDAMYQVTALCLGVDANAPDAQGRIRISWPTGAEGGSNPGWERDDDVCFLRIVPYRDPYGALLDEQYIQADGALIKRTSYTRCYEVSWICYGPHALETADALRVGILDDPAREMLRTRYHLYPLPHIQDPIRADELDGGQWWQRCDLTARFYEAAVRERAAMGFEQAQITTQNERG